MLSRKRNPEIKLKHKIRKSQKNFFFINFAQHLDNLQHAKWIYNSQRNDKIALIEYFTQTFLYLPAHK